jgi:hypothetical protein
MLHSFVFNVSSPRVVKSAVLIRSEGAKDINDIFVIVCIHYPSDWSLQIPLFRCITVCTTLEGFPTVIAPLA